ncbi:MAG: imidazolonepropionase [Bacteroidales bacterium]|nr:imidazolonepropionase [Bacteroidales bacterium]
MSETGTIRNAWLRIAPDGTILDFGPMDDLPGAGLEMGSSDVSGCSGMGMGGPTLALTNRRPAHPQPGIPTDKQVINAEGGMVLPAFCDSHTHIVYAGSRQGEFIDKINGLSYEQIAARGGGILNSSDLLHNTNEEELFRQSMERVQEMIAKGSATIEIKSGYGLNPEDELKMLRVIRRIKDTVPATIKSTFLGAHAVGRGYTKEQYVQEVIDMLPRAAELADFVDVFCDEGFFTPQDTSRILQAAARHGLRPKIHANELAESGGVQIGVKYNALSVDHLERAGDPEIEALKGSETMPTMLPGSSFFLGLPYGRATDFIAAGLGIALASDYNPGSSPMGDMRFVMALACIRMKLTPVQALNAVTLNSAYAMGVSHLTGSITPGKRADLIITLPGWTLERLPYTYQTPFIKCVLLKGVEFQTSPPQA